MIILKRSTILLVLMAGFSFSSQGQILNIEKIRLTGDTAKPFKAKVEANFNIYNRSVSNTDPVNFLNLTSAVGLVYTPGPHAYIFLNEVNYTADNKAEILNFGYVHGRVNFLHEKKFSYEVFAQYQYDRFRGLAERNVVGAAVRFAIYNRKKFSLYIGTGPMFESEFWKYPDAEEEVRRDVDFLKVSNYITTQWTIDEKLDLNAIVYYQVGYDNLIEDFRHRTNGTLNLNMQITKLLSFKTSLSMSFEDKPIIPISRFVYNLENGLSLNF